MIDKAIAKITEEAMECNSQFAEFIEEHLTGICTNEEVAAKLLNPEKSLKTFVEEIIGEYREKARKQGSGTQVVGDRDQNFYKKAEAYYEITDDDKTAGSGAVIDIMELLGGTL